MSDYIKKIIEDFPEEINTVSEIPAAEHLFKVWDDRERKKLPEEQAV